MWIWIEFSLKFVPKGSINNIPALVQVMAWHRPGDKPLSEPMMVSLLMHICVTWPQCVNCLYVSISRSRMIFGLWSKRLNINLFNSYSTQSTQYFKSPEGYTNKYIKYCNLKTSKNLLPRNEKTCVVPTLCYLQQNGVQQKYHASGM